MLRAAALPVLPANIAGAVLVYLYFNYVDPLEQVSNDGPYQGHLVIFLIVVTVILSANAYLSARWFGPLARWRRRLREGADPATVPATIRRRVLNAPLANTVLTQAGWTIAGVFYLVYLRAVAALAPGEVGRITAALILVALGMLAWFVYRAVREEELWRGALLERETRLSNQAIDFLERQAKAEVVS